VLSRYVDAIMIRILTIKSLQELAEHATVPVINGLTEILASLSGDGRHHDLRGASKARSRAARRSPGPATRNNVLTSWVHAAARFELQREHGRAEGTSPRSRRS
jgi:ornithine carbamoyltransferase